MARYFKKRAEALGKKPGELVYIGRKPQLKTSMDLTRYSGGIFEEQRDVGYDQISGADEDAVRWLNVNGISDLGTMGSLQKLLGLGPLTAADIMNTGTRPKYQRAGSVLYITLKMLSKDNVKNIIVSEQLSLILSGNMLITFQEAEGDVFGPVRERLTDKDARIRRSGADYLAYSLLDSIADNYILILQDIAEEVENTEELLLNKPDDSVLKRIIHLKKELLFLSKTLKPAKELVKDLLTESPGEIGDSLDFYRDLLSNLSHAAETVDLYKEIVSEQQRAYDTFVNNKLNEIMKFLTIFSVIFLPLTLVTGIYGTNFDFIPELHFRYGYIFLWGLLVILAVLMISIFKKKKWF